MQKVNQRLVLVDSFLRDESFRDDLSRRMGILLRGGSISLSVWISEWTDSLRLSHSHLKRTVCRWCFTWLSLRVEDGIVSEPGQNYTHHATSSEVNFRRTDRRNVGRNDCTFLVLCSTVRNERQRWRATCGVLDLNIAKTIVLPRELNLVRGIPMKYELIFAAYRGSTCRQVPWHFVEAT